MLFSNIRPVPRIERLPEITPLGRFEPVQLASYMQPAFGTQTDSPETLPAPPQITDGPIRPDVLRAPLPGDVTQQEPALAAADPLLRWNTGYPLGYTGPSSILPREGQESSHFVPLEDRWRASFPSWDRYDRGHPPVEDYPYMEGSHWDPYNQNVLKGDYPIIGQHTFLNITATSLAFFESRQVPTRTTPF